MYLLVNVLHMQVHSSHLCRWWKLASSVTLWNPASNVIALHHLCSSVSHLNILDCQDIRMLLPCQNTFQAWENFHFKQTAETQLDKHPWLITLLKHTHVRAMLILVTNWDDLQTDEMFVCKDLECMWRQLVGWVLQIMSGNCQEGNYRTFKLE